MTDYLETLRVSHSDHLEVHRDPDYVVVRRTENRPKVGLVSGCGAGNAPFLTGFVGLGLLDAACAGSGFTSPTVEQITAASKVAESGEGVLHIVPHLQGDSEAFKAAADQLRGDGIRVRDVIIDDDISSRDPRHTSGRRALGTVIAAARICGAAARADLHLNRIAQLCKQVNLHGKGLAAAIVSGTELKDSQVQVGVGLTGEIGIDTVTISTPHDLAADLTTRILADVPFTRFITEWDLHKWCWHEVEVRDITFHKGDQVLCLVSSLGPQAICDLDQIADSVAEVAANAGVRVVRRLTGHLMSAPTQAGISITLIKMTEEMLRYWDAPVQSPVLGDLHQP